MTIAATKRLVLIAFRFNLKYAGAFTSPRRTRNSHETCVVRQRRTQRCGRGDSGQGVAHLYNTCHVSENQTLEQGGL